MSVLDQDQSDFVTHGYFVRDRCISGETLEMLRHESALAVADQDEAIRRNGNAQDVTHAGRRYFIPFRSRERAALRDYVFSELLESVCRSTIGGDAWLFCEMFVVKSPNVGLAFGWHQDSGYLDYFKHGTYPPYVTTWLALEDMTEENGTLYVLPFSQGGARELVEHRLEEGTNDKVADFAGHSGIPLEVSAGSLVVLSSLVPHRSGPNLSTRPRSAYLCQFSPVPFLYSDDRGPVLMAEPFLKGGSRCK